MGYVLRGVADDRPPIERQVETAVRALETFVAYLRADRFVLPIRDDAGADVSLPQLLAEANRTTADDAAARHRLVNVLADLVETSLRPWDDAAPYHHPPDVYWRNAGQSWALKFEQDPPDQLLDELADRHVFPRCDLLLAAAREFLEQMRGARSRRQPERESWAREARPSPPSTPEGRPGPGRRRGMS